MNRDLTVQVELNGRHSTYPAWTETFVLVYTINWVLRSNPVFWPFSSTSSQGTVPKKTSDGMLSDVLVRFIKFSLNAIHPFVRCNMTCEFLIISYTSMGTKNTILGSFGLGGAMSFSSPFTSTTANLWRRRKSLVERFCALASFTSGIWSVVPHRCTLSYTDVCSSDFVKVFHKNFLW